MNILILVLSTVAVIMATEVENLQELLTEGNNKFTARMTNEVFKKHAGENYVLSAYSVLPILAQLSLAADGESHDQVLRAIGMPSDNVTKTVFSRMDSNLRQTKGVELKIANKMYVAQGYEINDEFNAVSREVFNSEAKNVDFTKNYETAKEINTWVEDHTNQRIKDLVDPDNLDSTTRMVIVNALYFKGQWENKFQPALTSDRDFHVTNDKIVKVPTMYRKGDYKYGESAELDAKLLEIFYEGKDSSLLIVLPNKIDGIGALQEKLKNPALLSKASQDMYSIEVEVFLPKFKIETETDLKTVLTEIGVDKIFDRKDAQLNRLLKNAKNLSVTSATQKCFIEVNEEGAEAAAANQFGISYLSAFIPETVKFIADHPYVFYLKKESLPLFTGAFQS